MIITLAMLVTATITTTVSVSSFFCIFFHPLLSLRAISQSPYNSWGIIRRKKAYVTFKLLESVLFENRYSKVEKYWKFVSFFMSEGGTWVSLKSIYQFVLSIIKVILIFELWKRVSSEYLYVPKYRCLSLWMSVCLSLRLTVCLSVCSVHLCICLVLYTRRW